MKIYEVSDKKKYLDLLLIGDEQESMIDKYLSCGVMFVLDDNGIKGETVVCDMGGGVLEIKNIAVLAEYRKCGYGKALIDFVCKKYKECFSVVRAGTGDSPLTVPFYEKCGFSRAYAVKNFFTDNYDYPIIEDGVTLKDMVYFEKKLK
ncbi:MAG: GNAT family N-acetyltransferase [Clostridia bacterium]|nr:GNAT family N-acetyltransferase [Clostridia bacterium]